MYCHACGERCNGTEAFCSHCGAKLSPIDKAKKSNIEVAAPKQEKQSSFHWLIPVMLFLTTAIGLAAYATYESNNNSQVVSLHQSAAKAALAGQYDEAVNLLNQAIDKRPNYTTLHTDLDVAVEAEQLQGKLANVGEQLKKNQIKESEEGLQELESALKKRKEPLFAPLKKHQLRQVML